MRSTRAAQRRRRSARAPPAFARPQSRRSRAPSARRSPTSRSRSRPGSSLGHRPCPSASVGAYAPGGRYPLIASSLMTVSSPKVAGVERVVACAPPRVGRGIHPPLLYAMLASGADGSSRWAASRRSRPWRSGSGGSSPVDMIVGAGNAYVAEAKRQLFGRVGIDLLAGPDRDRGHRRRRRRPGARGGGPARPGRARPDLAGGADHDRPRTFGRAVRAEVERLLEDAGRPRRSPAPRGATTGRSSSSRDRERRSRSPTSSRPSTSRCRPETTTGTSTRLRNYGSIFLGPHATVAFSDKGATGTNHVLPTGHAARYTGGLSVGGSSRR